MPLIKKPFVKYKEKKDYDIFSIRLSPEERQMLNEAKQILQQPKDGTAFKQLAKIGYIIVLQDNKIRTLLETIIDNKRKNAITGIENIEPGN